MPRKTFEKKVKQKFTGQNVSCNKKTKQKIIKAMINLIKSSIKK